MNSKNITILIAAIVILLGLFLMYRKSNPELANINNTQSNSEDNKVAINTNSAAATPEEPATAAIVSPISDATSRITKKFYGTYVTPQNSPVTPEKFKGFHTGLDFETTPEEKDADVTINTICEGKLLTKARATGYGGYAVQACTINGQAVTVVYGHLRQSSIKPNIGDVLKPGDALAVLGTGYSTETDGERKHLHLSIHIGTGINIKGYVQTQGELSAWMDPKTVLGL